MKEKFIKSSIILILGSLLTKLLGMIIRITLTRVSNIETINMYMLALPTFTLLMSISQLGFSTSISKLVSENRYKNKSLLFSVIPISIIINIILTIFLFIGSKYVAINLLHEPKLHIPILSISLVLPFDSLSSILRGFFFGKEKMFPHIVSHLIEQIVRLSLIIIIIPRLLRINTIYAVTGLILVNVFSELSSSLILLLFLPKNFNINKQDLIPNTLYIKNILNISIPTTTTRIIGSISYFFEPIILIKILKEVGYNISYIKGEYAIITAFVMPILLFPGFITNSISNAMLPIISREYVNGNIIYIKKKLKQALFLSLIIGIISNTIMFTYPEFFLKLFYKTNNGIEYLKFMLPFFILYYIEIPMSMFLQGINKSKNIMYDNIIGIIVKTFLLIILSYFRIGLYSLLISSIANILIVVIRHYKNIKKSLI